jgi:hypothetical protein
MTTTVVESNVPSMRAIRRNRDTASSRRRWLRVRVPIAAFHRMMSGSAASSNSARAARTSAPLRA